MKEDAIRLNKQTSEGEIVNDLISGHCLICLLVCAIVFPSSAVITDHPVMGDKTPLQIDQLLQ